MNAQLKAAKQTLRAFMRDNYTDAKLIELLEHARADKLSFYSCCCFIGIPTADHELRGRAVDEGDFPCHSHIKRARLLPGAVDAEDAFRFALSVGGGRDDFGNTMDEPTDAVRRRRLIPIILAEIRRRERLNAEATSNVGASRALAVK